jgi:hypothetical protein
LRASVPVKLTSRLISNNKLRICCESSGDSNPLLFAAAQLAWTVVKPVPKPNAFK